MNPDDRYRDPDRLIELGIPGVEDIREIGRGGFGVVYRGFQRSFRRPVAIKVLQLSSLDPQVLNRFERECQAMGALSGHPNIGNIHESGITVDGLPYLIMGFVPGGTLAQRVDAAGPIPWPEAVDITVRLAGALETAHRAGVLHRDVKPENVLISEFGEPILVDFGIAAIEGTARRTATGFITGTFAHAAPELLDGASASARSDVYALASTLYTLLAGLAPFVRATDDLIVSILTRIMREPPPDLRLLGLPDDLATIVEQALGKDPRSRPASAMRFGEQLVDLLRRQGLAPSALRVTGVEASYPDRSALLDETTVFLPPPAPGQDVPRTVAAAAAPQATVRSETVVLVQPDTPPAGGHRRRTSLLVVLAVLVLGVGGFTLAASRGSADKADETTASVPQRQVIDIGGTPGLMWATDAGIWVTDQTGGGIRLIDRRTLLPGPAVETGFGAVDIIRADGRLWVTNPGAGTVSIVDPGAGTVEVVEIGGQPVRLAASTESIWVSDLAGNRVVEIDIESVTVVAVTQIDGGPLGIAVDEDGVWVALNTAGALVRLDPATGEVADRVELGGTPFAVSLGADAVWVTVLATDELVRIDPVRLTADLRLSVGAQPIGLTVTDEAVWVACALAGEVRMLDPGTGDELRSFAVDGFPVSVVVDDDALWVSGQNSGNVTRLPR